MIITKDMLVAKGCDQQLLDEFVNNCPNGFDFFNDQMNVDFDFVANIAAIFSYTGLYTSECYPTIYQANYVNGYKNDLLDGQPCEIEVDSGSGQLLYAAFYKNGKLQNPDKYKPAELYYSSRGTLWGRNFYEDNKLNDPYPGVPAHDFWCFGTQPITRRLSFYDHGTLTREIVYTL